MSTAIYLRSGKIENGFFSKIDHEKSTEATATYSEERTPVKYIDILNIAYPANWEYSWGSEYKVVGAPEGKDYTVNFDELLVKCTGWAEQCDTLQQLFSSLEDCYDIDNK